MKRALIINWKTWESAAYALNRRYIIFDEAGAKILQLIRRNPDLICMSGSFNRAGEAYRIFVEELCRYREKVARYLSQASGADPEVCRELAACFHRVKGSAGLFGFETLRNAASELEKLMLELSAAGKEQERAELMLKEFVSLVCEVPPPGGAAGDA